jgi:hypothetical protein
MQRIFSNCVPTKLLGALFTRHPPRLLCEGLVLYVFEYGFWMGSTDHSTLLAKGFRFLYMLMYKVFDKVVDITTFWV